MSKDNKKNEDREDKTFENKLFELLFGANIGRRIAIFIIVVFVAIFVVNNIGFFDSININFTQANDTSSTEEIQTSNNSNNTSDDVSKAGPGFKLNIESFDWMTRDLAFPTHIHATFKLSANSTAMVYEIRMVFLGDVIVSYDVIPTAAEVTLYLRNQNTVLLIKGENIIDSDYIEIYALLDQPALDRIEIYGKTSTGSIYRDVITSEILKEKYLQGEKTNFLETIKLIGKVFIWVFTIIAIIILFILLIKLGDWIFYG